MRLVVALLVFASVWLSGPMPARETLLLPTTGSEVRRQRSDRSWVEDPLKRTVVCCLACFAAIGAMVGASAAWLGVALGAALSWWMGRLEQPSVTREREAVARELPLMIDLLSACAQAGRPIDQSLALVSKALGGAVAGRFAIVSARVEMGTEPLDEWRRLLADPPLAPLAKSVIRSLESGAPLAQGLERLADDHRRQRRTQTQLKARNVGVQAAVPLAACFLPAFMLIGVVPTIAGAFSHLIL